MDRTTVMAARVFVPTGVALLAAAILECAGLGLSGQPLLRGIAAEWGTLVAVAVIAAVGLAVRAAFRLWSWEQGGALDCPNCGGLLRRERDGRHGPYRKCFGCHKDIARINYA